MLDEPVHKSTPVIDDLTVDSHLRVLNAGDERAQWRHVNLDLFEAHDNDLTRDLFDRVKERLRIGSRATMCPMHEARSQPLPDRGDVARGNRRRELSRSVGHSLTLVHDRWRPPLTPARSKRAPGTVTRYRF
jgi:hypothetical protein